MQSDLNITMPMNLRLSLSCIDKWVPTYENLKCEFKWGSISNIVGNHAPPLGSTLRSTVSGEGLNRRWRSVGAV